jgi:hypothetical protein
MRNLSHKEIEQISGAWVTNDAIGSSVVFTSLFSLPIVTVAMALNDCELYEVAAAGAAILGFGALGLYKVKAFANAEKVDPSLI